MLFFEVKRSKMSIFGEHYVVLSSLIWCKCWKTLKKLRLDTGATNVDLTPLHGLLSAPLPFCSITWFATQTCQVALTVLDRRKNLRKNKLNTIWHQKIMHEHFRFFLFVPSYPTCDAVGGWNPTPERRGEQWYLFVL